MKKTSDDEFLSKLYPPNRDDDVEISESEEGREIHSTFNEDIH